MLPAAAAQTATPAPGIPLEVADARAASPRDLRYELRLTVPESRDDADHRDDEDRVRRERAARAAGHRLRDQPRAREEREGNGSDSAFTWTTATSSCRRRAESRAPTKIEIEFTRRRRVAQPQSRLPLRAVRAGARAPGHPCFDQPDLKARWSLSSTRPAKWQAASNGAESRAAARTGRPRTRRRFAETQPLSTYLFSFVVGDFKVETAERNGRTFRMFHRETDAAKVARNRDAIFDLHARAIAFMEEYTGIPYPFGKFDFVLIPAFQFGGMEHAGKILYNATGLLLDESATQNQYLGRASVISHETAHMWFGDLVTMRWFNDVWMKEVFANFMAAKIVNPVVPEVNHELRFLCPLPGRLRRRSHAGANAIRQPLDNLNEAGSLYGAIIYQKAPVVMRHLEQLMGEDVFRDGLRDYLKAYAFGNATWTDLIAVLDARTPVDLVDVEPGLGREPGRPTIRTELEVTRRPDRRLAFRQRDRRGRELVWPQQLRVVDRLRRPAATIVVPIMRGASVAVAEAVGLPAPRYVLPNGGGWAYGGFGSIASRSATCRVAARHRRSADARRGLGHAVGGDARRRVAPRRSCELAMAALPRETDEQLTQPRARLPRRRVVALPRPREREARAARAREAAASRARPRGDGQPEGGVVRRAARRMR